MRFTAFLLAFSAAKALAQGPLTPPAAPAPSMKTLNQIEARMPIPVSPIVPIPGPHFTITASGSYYLTGNIAVSTGSAIVIAGSALASPSSLDVTLDLNGFTISSTLEDGSAGSAIDVTNTLSQLTVRNGNIVSGRVSDYGLSITACGFEHGIVAGTSPNIFVTRVNVSGVAATGIDLNKQGIISECTADDCGGGGLKGNLVTNSSSNNCKGIGISAVNVYNCNSRSSDGDGILCTGTSNNFPSLNHGGSATNSTGSSILGSGLVCGIATNCIGTSTSGVGLSCQRNATNCTGTSTSGDGLTCDGNATNCIGTTYSASSKGVAVTSTASSCRGTNTAGGTALSAAIAIGCTTGGGVIISSQKHLGTP
jgi:hypothetical protein